PAVPNSLGQRGTLDIFGDHIEWALFAAARIVNRHNVRMMEVCDNSRLFQISLNVVEINDFRRVGHLDGHKSSQLLIPRQVDSPKTTLAEDSFNPVTADVIGVNVAALRLIIRSRWHRRIRAQLFSSII